MVRLKVGWGKIREFGVAFQFLDGAIKSFASYSAKLIFSYFNSLMVRLKDSNRLQFGSYANKFQFLDGAIKSLLLLNGTQCLPNFNSLMVRLKDLKRINKMR